MRKMILTAALAAILAATIAACGGDDGEGGEERLHPVLHDATYIQIQERREYVTLRSFDNNRHLSDRINAIHQGGYELQHTTRDRLGYPIFVFRKIAEPEGPASTTGRTPASQDRQFPPNP